MEGLARFSSRACHQSFVAERVDLVTIAALLRHSDVRTTLLYPVSTDEATRAAMSKIEDWIKAIDHEGDDEPK